MAKKQRQGQGRQAAGGGVFQQPVTADDLVKIHEILVASCGSKGIVPDIHSMESAEVVSMARTGYQELAADVDGELPPFDEAMGQVVKLYRSLSW